MLHHYKYFIVLYFLTPFVLYKDDVALYVGGHRILHCVLHLSSVMFTAHISNLVKNLSFICTLEIVKKILAFKVYSSKT